jgi:DNA-binding protein HU-beta
VNKTDLIADISSITGSRKTAEEAVNRVFDAIAESLGRGEPATFSGFGTFSVTERSSRKGRNPRTGEEIEIAARKVPKFTPGKQLKEKINPG